MRHRIPAGFMTQERANTMLASFSAADRDRFRDVVQALVWREPPARASRDDDDLDPEFAGLFRPQSSAEADARRRQVEQRVSASRDELDDDDVAMFRALFGRDPA